MQRLTLILAGILFGIFITCTALVIQTLAQPAPLLPPLESDDPLLAGEIQTAAAHTRTGKTRDWQAYAEILLGQGWYSYAEIAFRQTLRKDPQNFDARFGLAFCLDRTGRMKAGAAQYRKLAELQPSHPNAATISQRSRYAVGRLALREENTRLAERTFRQLSQYPPARFQLAKLLIRSGRTEEALPIVDETLIQFPESLEFQSLKFRCCVELNQPDEAAKIADELERARPEIPLSFNQEYVEPFSLRAGLEREIGAYNRRMETDDLSELSRSLEKFHALVADRRSPYRIIFLTGALNVAYQQRDPKKLQNLLRQLQDFGEMNAEVLQLEGAACALSGDLQQAAEFWERAARMSPNIPVYRKLAECYQAQGKEHDRDRALAKSLLLEGIAAQSESQWKPAGLALRKSLTLNPDDPQAWYYLGEVLRFQQQLPEAQEAYQQCLKLNPNYGRARQQLDLMRTNASGRTFETGVDCTHPQIAAS